MVPIQITPGVTADAAIDQMAKRRGGAVESRTGTRCAVSTGTPG